MSIILDGKALGASMRREIWEEAAKLPRRPGIAVILVGNDPASQLYVRNKAKDCAECGFLSQRIDFPASVTEEELLGTISKLNADAAMTRQADILIVAAGHPGLITADMVKEGAAVIDVAMNRDAVTGKFTGDVCFDEVRDRCSHITPVPGGVGPMTRAMLMKNVLTLARLHMGLS